MFMITIIFQFIIKFMIKFMIDFMIRFMIKIIINFRIKTMPSLNIIESGPGLQPRPTLNVI